MAAHEDHGPVDVDSSNASSGRLRGKVTAPGVSDAPVGPDDIERAAERVVGHVRRTPVIEYDGLWLKLELLQHAGSFKAREAFNRILSESAIPSAGVIAASGGNHGAAVAYAASQLGITAEIMIPSTSPLVKRALIERHGARAVVVEGYYDDAQHAAEQRQTRTGALDAPSVRSSRDGCRAGHDESRARGTTRTPRYPRRGERGWRLHRRAGSLVSRRVRVVSVEPETSQCLRAALQAGTPTDVSVAGIAADSLGARQLGRVRGDLRHFVDEAVVVTDDAIRDTQRAIWDDLRLISEPGGATALAAIRTGAYRPAHNERVAVALCGSNSTPPRSCPDPNSWLNPPPIMEADGVGGLRPSLSSPLEVSMLVEELANRSPAERRRGRPTVSVTRPSRSAVAIVRLPEMSGGPSKGTAVNGLEYCGMIAAPDPPLSSGESGRCRHKHLPGKRRRGVVGYLPAASST